MIRQYFDLTHVNPFSLDTNNGIAKAVYGQQFG